LAVPEKNLNDFFRFFLSSSIFNGVPRFILQFFFESPCGSRFINYSSDSNPWASLHQLKMWLVVPPAEESLCQSRPEAIFKEMESQLI
jgi:hypothetical protein